MRSEGAHGREAAPEPGAARRSSGATSLEPAIIDLDASSLGSRFA